MSSTEDRRTPGNKEVIEAVHELMELHLDEQHIDLDKATVELMVTEHRELYDKVAPLARDTNVKVTLIVNEMYGRPQPTTINPEARVGGMAETLVGIDRRMERFEAKASNGGFAVKKMWTQGQWIFFGTLGASFVAMAGTIIAAVIYSM